MNRDRGNPQAPPATNRLWLPRPAVTRRRWREARAIGTPGAMFQIILAPVVVAALAVAAVSIPLGMVTFVGLPMVALVIVSVPVIRSRDYDFASPWTLVVLSVLLGLVLRGIYIQLEWPDFETVNARWLLGQPVDFFTWPATLIALGLASFAVGYGFRVPFNFRRWPRVLRSATHNERRIRTVVFGALIFSFVMLVMFVDATGGLELDRISAKRTITGLDIEADYESFGHLRFLNGFGESAALLLLAHIAFLGKRLTGIRAVALTVLFVNAALLPFYVSSRGSLMMLGIQAVAIWIIAGRRMTLRSFVVFLLVSAVLFQVVTALRGSREAGFDEAVGAVDIVNVVDPLVLSRNLLNVPITGHIIDAIPSELEYAYGSTFLQAVATPIPRALWPGKPIIGTGKLVGAEVFGLERAGVPPGMVAEMYWNFGIPGVIIMPAVLGFLIRRLYETFRGQFGNMNIALMYTVMIMPLAFAMLAAEVSKTAFDLAATGARMFVLISFTYSRRWRY